MLNQFKIETYYREKSILISKNIWHGSVAPRGIPLRPNILHISTISLPGFPLFSPSYLSLFTHTLYPSSPLPFCPAVGAASLPSRGEAEL